MIKSIHIFLVLFSFFSFVTRVILAEFNSDYLQQRWLKIAPHVVDTFLILSGIMLVFQGQWLSRENDWLVAKLLTLIIYVALGIWTMHTQGKFRWVTFTGAVACYICILIVATHKNTFIFTGS